LINILEQREDSAIRLLAKVLKRFQELLNFAFSELKGLIEREAEDQRIHFLSLSDNGLSKSYTNSHFSGIKRFIEVDHLVLKI
jgi:hypothetical protein